MAEAHKLRHKRWVLWHLQGGLCFWCKCLMRHPGGKDHPNSSTLDHIIPKSKGGMNTWRNLVLACRECNEARGTMTATEYAQKVAAQ